MSNIFYPKSSGLTKREVIDWINERLEDDTWSGSKPNIKKLSDKRMQEFVDDWTDRFYDNLEEGVESACEAQEEVLEELAEELCSNFDPDQSYTHGPGL